MNNFLSALYQILGATFFGWTAATSDFPFTKWTAFGVTIVGTLMAIGYFVAGFWARL